MKNHFYYFQLLLLLTLGGIIFGCSNSNIDEITSTEHSLSDKELLQALGYDLSGLIECDEYYIIKPDIIISKSRLEAIRETPQTRMEYRKDNGIIETPYQTIYLNASNVDAYQQEFEEAVAEWNNLPESNIKFIIVSDRTHSPNVNVLMLFNGVVDGQLMAVERPYRGFPGGNLYINLSEYPTNFAPINYRQVKYLVMHALGHIVGFEHVYPSATSLPSITYPNTDKYDAKSIMRTEDDLKRASEVWYGFSTLDKKAIKIIYPIPIPQIPTATISCKTEDNQNIKNNILDIGKNYILSVDYDKTKFSGYTLSASIQKIDGGNGDYQLYCPTQFGPPIKYEVTFNKPGKYQFKVMMSKGAETYLAATTTYQIYAQESWIEGPNNVELGKIYNFTTSFWNPNYPNPKFNVEIEETLFNDPQYTIISQTNDNLKIRFNEPGEYVLTASTQYDQEGSRQVRFHVNVYYQHIWEHIPSENRVYFYTDETKTSLLNIPHRGCFTYQLYIGTIGGKRKYRLIKIPVASGSTYIDFNSPNITLTLPANNCSLYNPYIPPPKVAL